MSIDEILAGDDLSEMVMEIYDELEEICDNGNNIHILTPPQQVFFLVQKFDSFMNNDGFTDFFLVTPPTIIQKTKEALEEIKAKQLAKILAEALKLWPNQNVPEQKEERIKVLETNFEIWKNAFQKLNDQYLQYPDELEVLEIDYVDENKEEFK